MNEILDARTANKNDSILNSPDEEEAKADAEEARAELIAEYESYDAYDALLNDPDYFSTPITRNLAEGTLTDEEDINFCYQRQGEAE